jgi:hypothetical protein
MNMPKEGYKSITVPDDVYNYFWNKWQQSKEEYRAKHGIRSFSGFVTKFMNDMIELETQKEPKPALEMPVLEHYNLNEQGVMILDRSIDPPKGKLIEVYFKPMPDNMLQAFCEYDETDRCRHVDFALDLPEVQEIISKKGWTVK